MSSKGCMIVWVLFFWIWEKGFLKGCHPECLKGVIQNVWRVSSRMFEGCHPECLNGVIQNVRMVSSRMCEWCHPECVNGVIQNVFIQRFYNCMSFILLNMRERVESILFDTMSSSILFDTMPSSILFDTMPSSICCMNAWIKECSRRMFRTNLIGIPL